jgi:hypothetical protein
MKKRLALVMAIFFFMGFGLVSCAGIETKPTEATFKIPTLKLHSIQPTHYEGFWHYEKVQPERGKAPAGGGSSPVSLNFVFEITNPNDFSVQYESSSFFLFFEDYELRIVNDTNSMWIPPGKTSSKVLFVTVTPFNTFQNFLLRYRDIAAKKGDKPWEKIEFWWTKLPEMAFPIYLKEGNFTFSADGITKVVPVDMKYP